VVLQRELADGEEELLAPAGVVVGGEVEDDRHEKPDFVDGNGLGVQVKEGGGLMHLQVGGVRGGVRDMGRLLVVIVLDAGSRGGGLRSAAARARAARARAARIH
jgi:hypothetical protein